MGARGWIQELRRRRVLRAAAAYGIAAFGLLQGAEVVVSAFDLSHMVLTVSVVATLAGFPVAMVLAWFFDIGPEGIERTPPVRFRPWRVEAGALPRAHSGAPGEGSRPAAPLPRPPWWSQPRWRTIGLAALVVTLFTAWRIWPRPDRFPSGRVAIAVADFANETGDRQLDGLSSMLITSLEQSQRLVVLTRSHMLDALKQRGRGDVERIDETMGREVARDAGVRALVLPSIHRFDAVYAIELKALDPATNQYLFALDERGKGKGSIPGLIDRLSERTREQLREGPAEISASRVRVASAVTANLEAFQHYFRGRELQSREEYAEAIEEFRRAAAADPQFAMAHFAIAYVGEFAGLPAKARTAAMRDALRVASSAPEKLQLLIRAWEAHVAGREADAGALYRRAVERFPLDKEVLYAAGDHHFHAGRVAEAADLLRRALALDPGFGEALDHLVDALHVLGRRDEMIEVARRSAEKAPRADILCTLGVAHALRREWPEALDAYRAAVARGGGHATEGLMVDTLLLQGRLAEAEAAVAPLGDPTRPAIDRVTRHVHLAKVRLLQGRHREAWRELQRARSDPGVTSTPQFWIEQLELASIRRDADAAREAVLHLRGTDLGIPPALVALAGDLGLADEVDRERSTRTQHLNYQGYVAYRGGDLAAAEAALRTSASVPNTAARIYPAPLLAEIYAAQGRDAEAIAALSMLRDTYWFPLWRAGLDGPAHVLAARSLERLGRPAEALAELDAVLALVDDPDPDLAFVADARQMRTRLLGAAIP
jgi:tetratricopeptide (TPR) repeat protein